MNKHRVLTILLSALGMLLTLTACGGIDMSDLSGKREHWQLSAMIIQGKKQPLHNTHITLSFMNNKAMVGNGGINNYHFPVNIDNGEITPTGTLATTRMAGALSAMDTENRYFTILRNAKHIRREAHNLIIATKQDDRLIYQQQR